MIFDVPAIIEHFSRGTTLEAGDVILSGTPQGESVLQLLRSCTIAHLLVDLR